jgi:sec-independent protein translocase protein TatB
MFEIGWTEIMVIAVVAIVVFPSKDLPKLLRSVGHMVGKVRRMAGDFQGQFNAALREAEREIDLEETRRKVEEIKSLNPMTQVKQALNPLTAPLTDIKNTLEAPLAETDASGDQAADGDGASSTLAGQFVQPASDGTGGRAVVQPPATAGAVPPPPTGVDVPPPAVVPPAGNPTLSPVGSLAPNPAPAAPAAAAPAVPAPAASVPAASGVNAVPAPSPVPAAPTGTPKPKRAASTPKPAATKASSDKPPAVDEPPAPKRARAPKKSTPSDGGTA